MYSGQAYSFMTLCGLDLSDTHSHYLACVATFLSKPKALMRYESHLRFSGQVEVHIVLTNNKCLWVTSVAYLMFENYGFVGERSTLKYHRYMVQFNRCPLNKTLSSLYETTFYLMIPGVLNLWPMAMQQFALKGCYTLQSIIILHVNFFLKHKYLAIS